MKKWICVLTFVGLASTAIWAQFGVKAGVNLAYLSGLDDVVTIKEPGFAFQLAAIYRHTVVEKHLAFQGEVKFIRKASSYEIGSYDIEGHFDYLEIPVLGIYSIFDGAVGLQFGPQFGFLTGARWRFDHEDNPAQSYTDRDLDNYNSFDVGIGMGVNLNTDPVFLELRHNIGLISLDKNIMLEGSNQVFNTRNYNTEFCIGLFF